MTEHGEFYWCLTHERVEAKGEGPADERLGPYPTAEAARNWKATRDARQETWDDADRRWEGE